MKKILFIVLLITVSAGFVKSQSVQDHSAYTLNYSIESNGYSRLNTELGFVRKFDPSLDSL